MLFFHHAHPHTLALELLSQVVADAVGAGQKYRVGGIDGHAQLGERLAEGRGSAGEVECIPGCQHEVSLGDGDLAIAHHGADQKVDGHFLAKFMEGQAAKRARRGEYHLHQLGASLGQHLHPGRRGEAQDAADLLGGRQLGVDGHGETKLVAVKVRMLGILQIAHPGDGVLGAHHVGGEAGEDVELIGVRDGDEDVGVCRPHLLERSVGCAVAPVADDVQTVAQSVDHIGVGVYHGDRASVLAELCGQGAADLAGADDMDVDFPLSKHGSYSFSQVQSGGKNAASSLACGVVRVTGLEPAASWSQTTRSTN